MPPKNFLKNLSHFGRESVKFRLAFKSLPKPKAAYERTLTTKRNMCSNKWRRDVVDPATHFT